MPGSGSAKKNTDTKPCTYHIKTRTPRSDVPTDDQHTIGQRCDIRSKTLICQGQSNKVNQRSRSHLKKLKVPSRMLVVSATKKCVKLIEVSIYILDQGCRQGYICGCLKPPCRSKAPQFNDHFSRLRFLQSKGS